MPVLTPGAHPSAHPWARGGRTMGVVPHVATFEAVGLLTGSCAAAPGFTKPLTPPAIADAYRRIALVTQSPLFAPERVQALEHGGLDW